MTIRHKIGLLLTFLIGITWQGYSQYIDTVCPGDRGAVYAVHGFPDSYFYWTVTGGEIVHDFGDTIVVNWGYESGVREISVIEENVFGCFGEEVNAEIIVAEGPSVDLGQDVAFCEGDSGIINASTGGDVTGYVWHNGSTSDEIVVRTPGDVYVQVTDDKGCRAWDTMNVVVHPLPVFDIGHDTTLCRREGMYLYADNPDYNYIWSSDQWDVNKIGSYIAVYMSHYDQVIIAEAIDDNYCRSTDTVTVFHCPNGLWDIVNVFTPNDDGKDDTWQIHGIGYYPEAEIQVFDRWGRLVFRTKGLTDDNTGWDGTDLQGRKLPMDSYHYIINFHTTDIEPAVGVVTIVR